MPPQRPCHAGQCLPTAGFAWGRPQQQRLPLLLGQHVEALAHEYCQRGVPVTFSVYPGLPHSDAAVPVEAQALAFLGAQFKGHAAPNGCALIGQGNSLAPLPQPGS